MMEAVSRRFIKSATTFHPTSTRPMSQYSPFPLGIRTNACHVASSASRPSPKSTVARSNILSQCVIYLVSVSLVSSGYSPPSPQIASPVPSVASTAFAYAATASYFHGFADHPLRCSILIPEVPPKRFFLSRFTANSI